MTLKGLYGRMGKEAIAEAFGYTDHPRLDAYVTNLRAQNTLPRAKVIPLAIKAQSMGIDVTIQQVDVMRWRATRANGGYSQRCSASRSPGPDRVRRKRRFNPITDDEIREYHAMKPPE